MEKSINTVYTLKTFLQEYITLPFPTISLINGACMGGGLELALSCDFRIAADNAFFALPESKLGIIPGAGGTQLLPRIIGIQEAKKLIYSSAKIDSEYALKIGLVDEVCKVKNLKEKGEKIVKSFYPLPNILLKLQRHVLMKVLIWIYKSSLNIEFREYIKTLDTDERKDIKKV